MAETLTWDNEYVESQVGGEEAVSEADAKRAEAGGQMPIGKFLCICRESTPREKNFNNYDCIAANLKWEVIRPVEVEGKAPTQEQVDALRGRSIYDDVCLPHAKEKDGMKNRRILVAKRCGLLAGGGVLNMDSWRRGIIGKRAVLTVIHEKSEKTGKTYAKVSFDGYEAEAAPAGKAPQGNAGGQAPASAPAPAADSFDDI